AWRGDLALAVTARGGPLDSLQVDSLAATFHDARTGAVSRVRASGSVALGDTVPRLLDAAVRVDSLAIRTLGAVAPAADSISGMIEGTARLSGDASLFAFRDVRLRHVDGNRAASVVSGSGTLRPDRRGRWLSANATLDTLALATLARGIARVSVAGTPHGRVSLAATGDTLTVRAGLADGTALVQLNGSVLLLRGGPRVAFDGTMRELDPRHFVPRA